MSEKDGLGSKFLGLFVEREGATAEKDDVGDDSKKSAAQIVAELAAKAPAPPPPLKVPLPSGPVTPATVDFDQIFRDAGMDATELDRVKKAEDLLKSLPESTPHEVKKQIVEASLKAFGFEVAKIVAAANNQNKALETYVRVNEGATVKGINDAEVQIKTLTEKIAAAKAEIEKRTQGLASVTAAAQLRKTQVAKVLEFFAQPVAAPSKGNDLK